VAETANRPDFVYIRYWPVACLGFSILVQAKTRVGQNTER
jgi:hypothetical protein